MIFPFKTPLFIQMIFPALVWKIKTKEKIIYLTFDDGPVEEVTPFVLDELKQVNAKATFFCIGDNIQKHPHIYHRINAEGHVTANHTFNHLSGWKTDNREYFENINKCESYLKQNQKLFRPPYGKLTFAQMRKLKQSYKIIMWDVLSGDFEKKLDSEKCLNSCIKKTSQGSIVVFHDSFKAFPILKAVLPKYLKHFNKLGYKFEAIQL
ncbi:MAG: polysaccharide deacetylase family protein [Cytophagales bacterium]